ncbi:MAG: hypothetical protein J1F43_03135 [Muribaculaceae bacterium]|nr:hypothetical protein [Muribaculaceae bacterium]
MKKGGVEVKFSRDFGGKINGIIFTSGSISYAGFKVDPSLSYNKLANLMGQFEVRSSDGFFFIGSCHLSF